MHSRTDILNTAGDLFSEHGYHGTTMRDLAKALDLRGASLYSHIKSKEEMLWEIVNRAADQFQAQAEAIPHDIPVEEQLKRLVKGHLEVIANELPYAITFFHEWKFLTPELRDQVKERRDSHEAHFRRVIEEGMRLGVFHVEDSHLAMLFVLSALNGTYQWFRLDGPLSIDEVADRYVTLILSALNAHR